MYHIGGTIRVEEDDPRSEEIWASLLATACDCYGLCSSAGCSCVVGSGEKRCSEVYHGERMRVAASEGPTWLTLVWALPSSINFDLYFDEEVPPTWDSRREMTVRLIEYGLPVTWRQTSDDYSKELIGVV